MAYPKTNVYSRVKLSTFCPATVRYRTCPTPGYLSGGTGRSGHNPSDEHRNSAYMCQPATHLGAQLPHRKGRTMALGWEARHCRYSLLSSFIAMPLIWGCLWRFSINRRLPSQQMRFLYACSGPTWFFFCTARCIWRSPDMLTFK